jgi:hypothetical protein
MYKTSHTLRSAVTLVRRSKELFLLSEFHVALQVGRSGIADGEDLFVLIDDLSNTWKNVASDLASAVLF